MKPIRSMLTLVALLLLAGGYLMSVVVCVFGNDPAGPMEYATKVDAPPIRLLALILFVAAIALSLVKDEQVDTE